jgi:sialate O-acetylesterase
MVSPTSTLLLLVGVILATHNLTASASNALRHNGTLNSIDDGSTAPKLRLPTFVDSHMVLQREPQKARIWGWAAPGANVTSTLTQIGLSSSVISDEKDGAWIIEFPPQPAGDGHTIEIKDDSSTIVLEDIAFGDVFLCSGQSNMEMTVGAVFDAKKEVADAINYPNLRLATVAKVTSDVPMDDVASKTYYSWARSSPEAITGNETLGWQAVFSATCYFFGRDLYRSMNGTVPVGLLVSCWGGQKVEAFSSADALADETCGGTLPGARPDSEDKLETTLQSSFDSVEVESMQLWNAMIHPLLPMRFVAALWYQGEANEKNAISYACRFPAMISDWRVKFNLPNLSFLYVQLAGFSAGGTWPWLRAAQDAALQLPGVGMATAIDLGDPSNKSNGPIHPRRKQEVGRRLALTMRAIRYKDPKAQFNYAGPTLAGVGLQSSPTHSSIVLSFQPGTAHTLHIAGAAACTNCCQDAPFLVLDVSGKWTRVSKAEVRNTDEIHLFTAVPQVFGIRYAWEPRPECILYNGIGGPDDHGGLAAPPFEWCAYPSGKPHWTDASCLVVQNDEDEDMHIVQRI